MKKNLVKEVVQGDISTCNNLVVTCTKSNTWIRHEHTNPKTNYLSIFVIKVVSHRPGVLNHYNQV